MRTLAAALLFAAVAAVPTAAPRAQISQEPNTGCPASTWPSVTGAPAIGQQLGFAWSCALPTQLAIAMLGDATGGGFRLGSPLTCETGPCTWFPGPIGGAYHAWPVQIGGGSWTLDIPNLPMLVGTSWGIQCVCWCP